MCDILASRRIRTVLNQVPRLTAEFSWQSRPNLAAVNPRKTVLQGPYSSLSGSGDSSRHEYQDTDGMRHLLEAGQVVVPTITIGLRLHRSKYQQPSDAIFGDGATLCSPSWGRSAPPCNVNGQPGRSDACNLNPCESHCYAAIILTMHLQFLSSLRNMVGMPH